MNNRPLPPCQNGPIWALITVGISASFRNVRTRTATEHDRLRKLNKVDLSAKEGKGGVQLEKAPTRVQLTHVCPRLLIHDMKLTAGSVVS